MASQITSLKVVYSIVYSGADQRKHQNSARVTGLCVGYSPGPVNSPYKGPVTQKMFPFDDVIMIFQVQKSLAIRALRIGKQDCFLQKEARVCVSNAFVLEDSMYE